MISALRSLIRRSYYLREVARYILDLIVFPKQTMSETLTAIFPSRLVRAANAVMTSRTRPPKAANTAFHVIMVNDVGFQYGAGIAMRRQAASFLLNGWQVSLVSLVSASRKRFHYTGVTGFPDLDRRLTQTVVGEHPDSDERLVETVMAASPDLVITGNLHNDPKAAGIMSKLKHSGLPIVAYMHDCYWVTGRCGYPGSCGKFISGCDHHCPTPGEYPKLAPDQIAKAWRARSDLFAGQEAIPLATNSKWSKSVAERRWGTDCRVSVLPLAVDHQLFSPINKSLARSLLHLPKDRRIVLMGAIDLTDKRKGGAIFAELNERLNARDDVDVILVGRGSDGFKCLRSFGLIEDERIMPFILSAADVVVSTAVEEAFGQMILEASACGVPTVAFDVGGISDIIDATSGILVSDKSADAIERGIDRVLADRDLAGSLGRSARLVVETKFTLRHQSDAWADFVLQQTAATNHRIRAVHQ